MDEAESDLQNVQDATRAVGTALAEKKYAIVGGAACVLLGSRRVTKDVDFVVPKGETVEARKILKGTPNFTVEPRTAHTYYKSESSKPLEIEILTPPVRFQDKFDSDTPTITHHNVKVLKPALLLNAKCCSILSRASDDKKASDAVDIQFLLEYHVQTKTKLTAEEVPMAKRVY